MRVSMSNWSATADDIDRSAAAIQLHWTPPKTVRPSNARETFSYGCTGRRLFLTTSVAIARPRTSPASWS